MQANISDTPIPLISVEELREVLGLGTAAASNGNVLAAAGLPANALADPRGHLGVDAVWRLFSAQIAATGDELLGLGSQPHPAGLTEIIVARSMQRPWKGQCRCFAIRPTSCNGICASRSKRAITSCC
ncbi:AraC family transcriptional regulator ligand-binding domain-containing protein [Marinobacter salarius]|uniref:AraC family transcriptional regulator ligand-binding domain-containing protein n=1 Tax=Marinobacter salarius TaxID=1420917 RepID=UPI0032EFCFEB